MTLLSTIAKLFTPLTNRPAAKVTRDCSASESMGWSDGEFSSAVTALGAKLASADGDERPQEFETFASVFQPRPTAEADIRRLYNLARKTTLGFEGYARKIARRYGHCPIVLERVLDGLFQLALADGVITERETAYLERVARGLGVSPAVYRAVKARRLGLTDEDPYVVLEIDPSAPDDAVRAAWRKALVATHPDKALAMGLPRELVEKAQIKAQAINAAFDKVMRERSQGFGAAAAWPAEA